MTLFRPTELHALLHTLGVKAKKTLSQNFLIDGNIMRKMVSIGGAVSGSSIIEIGPGPGALTAALLETGAHVLAIEKDTVFAGALERLQTPDGRLQVVCQDALLFPFAQQPKCRVIANLPYHIATPILTRLLPLHQSIEAVTIMIQKEMAERLCAQRGSPNYSSLSVFASLFSTPRIMCIVEPTCFFPQPSVKSAIVHIPLKPPPPIELENFIPFVRTAFNQRRKMLRSSLKERFGAEKITSTLETLGLNPQARPEELSLEDFIRFFHHL